MRKNMSDQNKVYFQLGKNIMSGYMSKNSL